MRMVLKGLMQVVTDLLVLSVALWLAFLMRLDWTLTPEFSRSLYVLLPFVLVLEYALLLLCDVPRFSWRYVGLREMKHIFLATLLSGAIVLGLRVFGADYLYNQGVMLPITVVCMNVLLGFMGVTGVRVLTRLIFEKRARDRRGPGRGGVVPTLLIGAGKAGLFVAREIDNRPDLNIQPLGFLDDDPHKLGKVVHGIPVLGRTSDVRAYAAKLGARQALITIVSATGPELRKLALDCEDAGLSVKILPGLGDIVGGRVNLSRIRDVAIEDLLRREAVVLDTAAIAENVEGRTVLVTGAGGSIGSELCRQICQFKPRKLVLVEASENALFHIERELRADFAAIAAVPVLADLGDAARMNAIFAEYRPSVVYHAGAHKHVPMMECNPWQAVRNNVLGTRRLADAAHAAGVQEFVMISTDKAVNPTSVMGVSKRVAELYIQSLSQRSQTRFVTVRFGNVLGSAGSVIPIFKEQIAAGGPVTVTHPDMQRYFMTIPEACQLVLQAAAMGKGGEIFILDMGEPVKIVELARDLIRLSGFRPDADIMIKFTGIRPGEKLFEELSTAEESADKTRHPKVFVGRFRPCDNDTVAAQVEALGALATSTDAALIRARFKEIVPEYTPHAPAAEPPRESAATRDAPLKPAPDFGVQAPALQPRP